MSGYIPATISEAEAIIARHGCQCHVINAGTAYEHHVGYVRWPGVPVGHALFGKALK